MWRVDNLEPKNFWVRYLGLADYSGQHEQLESSGDPDNVSG